MPNVEVPASTDVNRDNADTAMLGRAAGFEGSLHRDVIDSAIIESFAHSETQIRFDQRNRLENLVFANHARQIFDSIFDESTQTEDPAFGAIGKILLEWSRSQHFRPWCRPFGHVWMQSIFLVEPIRTGTVLETAINANIAGVKAQYSFELDDPVSFRLGRHYFANAIAGSIDSDGRKVICSISFQSGNKCSFGVTTSCEGSIRLSNESFSTTLPEHDMMPGASLVLIPPSLVNPTMLPPYASSEFLPFNEAASREVAVEHAIKLLACVPSSLSWVASVIREIVLIRNFDGVTASSSSPWECGTVALTAVQDPLLIAEMLVHEASHQHFFIAKHLGRMDDGSDQKQYHSPMVNNTRPLEKILLAFHALGNMAIFHWKIILACHHRADSSRERLAEIRLRLKQVQPTLEQSIALTSLGRSIYNPLAKKLEIVFST